MTDQPTLVVNGYKIEPGANFRDVDLEGVDLEGVDLEGVVGLGHAKSS